MAITILPTQQEVLDLQVIPLITSARSRTSRVHNLTITAALAMAEEGQARVSRLKRLMTGKANGKIAARGCSSSTMAIGNRRWLMDNLSKDRNTLVVMTRSLPLAMEVDKSKCGEGSSRKRESHLAMVIHIISTMERKMSNSSSRRVIIGEEVGEVSILRRRRRPGALRIGRLVMNNIALLWRIVEAICLYSQSVSTRLDLCREDPTPGLL
jgi:hypothetical protein